MKKKIILSLVAVAALAIGVAGMSAFESHVINVTAKIENALTVPLEADGLSFGTVFPEEVANKTFDMSLSQSFMAETSVDDVQYTIRQKPKCICPSPVGAGFVAVSECTPGDYAQVTEDASGNFACPAGYVEMPLLCPFLSKHEIPDQGTNEQVGAGIDAFHGPLTSWTMADTLASQVSGHLSKQQGDTSDTWNIDLHAPCFKGQCAQDDKIPADYQPDPTLNSQVFGCDLWIEVTSLSTPNGEPPTLTVNKVLVPSQDPGKFNLQINGITAGTGANVGDSGTTGAITETAGNYTVGETAVAGTNLADYNTVIGGACASDGSVTLFAGDQKTCTITNTKKSTTGTLTVIKHVDNTGGGTNVAGNFTMNVTGTSPSPSSFAGAESPGTNVILTAGSYSVDETGPSGYTKSLSTDCSGTIAAGDHKTCTITNTYVTICKFSLDVMMDMDRSGSMGYDLPTRLSLAKTAADSFLGNLGTGDQSGLVSFATTATLDEMLSNNHAATQTMIDSLTALGATDIGDAINLANGELVSIRHNPLAAKIEILVTDGMANKPSGPGYDEFPADVTYALAKAGEAATAGIKIFTIGLGTGVDATMLQQIATATGGNYYFAPTAGDLQAIFDLLKQDACK